MQIYKKVLLLPFVIIILGFFSGCQVKTIPKNYPNRPGFFPITIPYKEYRLKRNPIRGTDQFVRANKKRKKQLDRINKKIDTKGKQDKSATSTEKVPDKNNTLKTKKVWELDPIEIVPNEDSQKLKKQILKEQKEGRKKHFEMQTPDVQKRMKESLKESEKLRKHRTSLWTKIKFLLRNCVKW